MADFQVAVVDCFGSTLRYIELFEALGGAVIHVQSSPVPLFGFRPADPSRFSHVLVADGDIDVIADKLATLEPVAVLAGKETGVELADLLAERLGLSSSNGTALSA